MPNGIHPIRIHHAYWIIQHIIIRRPAWVVLRQRIHRQPPPDARGIVACPKIVETRLHIAFFACELLLRRRHAAVVAVSRHDATEWQPPFGKGSAAAEEGEKKTDYFPL